MFNLSGSEIVVILLLALVVLGPEKLPDALRRAGRTYSELKKMGNSFQAEMKSVLDEPMKEMRETADLLKKSVDFSDGELTGTGKPTRTSSTTPPPAATTVDADTEQPAAAGVVAPVTSDPDTAPPPTDGPVGGDANSSTPHPLSAEDDLINRTLSGES